MLPYIRNKCFENLELAKINQDLQVSSSNLFHTFIRAGTWAYGGPIHSAGVDGGDGELWSRPMSLTARTNLILLTNRDPSILITANNG